MIAVEKETASWWCSLFTAQTFCFKASRWEKFTFHPPWLQSIENAVFGLMESNLKFWAISSLPFTIFEARDHY